MARTTITDVRIILPSSTQLTDLQIQCAIESASCIVEQIAVGCSSHLTDECLAKVETYLSAHFCAVTESTLSISSEKDACTGSSVTYGFQLGEGVKGSPYGQTANMISGGCLVGFDNQPAQLFSLGGL